MAIAKESQKKYRDKLVDKIKMAGQELIDRAESMVAEDMDAITDFHIKIKFPIDGPIDISANTFMVCKNEFRSAFYQDVKEEKECCNCLYYNDTVDENHPCSSCINSNHFKPGTVKQDE